VQSKNKPSMTAAERRHVAMLKEQPCAVCDAPGPSDVHEPEQGLWFASLPLCAPCHTGPRGWHGDRQRWKLRRIFSEIVALDRAMRRLAV